jgi:hypothetical protein
LRETHEQESVAMFDQLTGSEESEERKPTDWSGTIIGVALLPVFFLFVYLGKAEMGFSLALVLGMVLIAIRLQWGLRKHVCFWVTIVVVLTLHIPLLFLIQWPNTKSPTIAYAMPFGIADFLIVSGAIRLSKRLFLKDCSPEDDVQ